MTSRSCEMGVPLTAIHCFTLFTLYSRESMTNPCKFLQNHAECVRCAALVFGVAALTSDIRVILLVQRLGVCESPLRTTGNHGTERLKARQILQVVRSIPFLCNTSSPSRFRYTIVVSSISHFRVRLFQKYRPSQCHLVY